MPVQPIRLFGDPVLRTRAIEVVDFDADSGLLLLRLGGTCQGCAAASITLKQGIEVRLRDAVPEVRQIEAV